MVCAEYERDTRLCFEASMADVNAQNALRQLQETATFLRVLGSYPADDSKL